MQTDWGGERNSLESRYFLKRRDKETKTNPELDILTTFCNRLSKDLGAGQTVVPSDPDTGHSNDVAEKHQRHKTDKGAQCK